MKAAFLRTALQRPALQRLVVVVAIAVLACGIGGCGTINHYMAIGMEGAIPAWAGGLPADAPPRPGTVEYDEFMRQREAQRQQPAAAKKDDAGPSTPLALGPVY
jgi:hypothetical protein